MTVEVGQSWSYQPPEGFAESRLIVGAIVETPSGQRVICVSVSGAPRREPDGSVSTVTIPFLPLTHSAFLETVRERDAKAVAEPAASFTDALVQWRDDPRGLTMFTVHFDGFLDRMIARQMAAIVGSSEEI